MKKKITIKELKSLIKEEASKLQRRTLLENEKKAILKELGELGQTEVMDVDDFIRKIKNSDYSIEDFEQKDMEIENFIYDLSSEDILDFFNKVKDYLPFTEGHLQTILDRGGSETENIGLVYKIVSKLYDFDVELSFDVTDIDGFIYLLLDKYGREISNLNASQMSEKMLNKIAVDTIAKNKNIDSIFGLVKLSDDALLYIFSKSKDYLKDIVDIGSHYEEFLQNLLEYDRYKSFSYMMDISNPFNHSEFKGLSDDYNIPDDIKNKYLPGYEDFSEPHGDYDNWVQ